MLRFWITGCLLVTTAAGTLTWELDADWDLYKTKYSKQYDNTVTELKRRAIWEDNLNYIQQHNAELDRGLRTFRVRMNTFGDLTAEEFAAKRNGLKSRSGTERGPCGNFVPPSHVTVSDLPTEVDWRQKGYVTYVKNQEECGSCWAFSATGALEGQHFNKTGQLVSLSEQNLMDCSRLEDIVTLAPDHQHFQHCVALLIYCHAKEKTPADIYGRVRSKVLIGPANFNPVRTRGRVVFLGPAGNHGCEGGLMDRAFEYVIKRDGIESEDDYPYRAQDEIICEFNRHLSIATATSCQDIAKGNEIDLQVAVATVGPISVGIDASPISFQFYDSGVYVESKCSTKKLDHGVLVVGYGTLMDKEYWLVKNSWGTDWGMNGYILMARNHDNMCGIATQASFPIA